MNFKNERNGRFWKEIRRCDSRFLTEYRLYSIKATRIGFTVFPLSGGKPAALVVFVPGVNQDRACLANGGIEVDDPECAGEVLGNFRRLRLGRKLRLFVIVVIQFP